MKAHRIGFIGLGGMGLGMASRLIESGYEVTVYNRTRSKCEEVARLGGRIADSPQEMAAGADVVMLSLADHHVVDTVLSGEKGVFAGLHKDGFVIDLSTVPPGFARDVWARAREAGFHSLDACVLGNPQHARKGELRVMVGGEEADYHSVDDILAAIGKEVVYLGGSGMGASMKLVLNMLMGSQMTALAEAVVFGEQAGLPREKILQMIAQSGYSSPVMSFRCAMMEKRAFHQAAFKLALMRKDVMLVLNESRDLVVPLPVTESAFAMLTAAERMGLGELDVAAMLAFMERLSGMDSYPWPIPASGRHEQAGPPRENQAGPPRETKGAGP